MRRSILIVVVAACGGRVHGAGDAGASQTAVTTGPVPAGMSSSGIDFICPSQPLNEGTQCAMPSNEQCKYYVGGQWVCLVCDKTGHWTRRHC
jgi:hypothetical protein